MGKTKPKAKPTKTTTKAKTASKPQGKAAKPVKTTLKASKPAKPVKGAAAKSKSPAAAKAKAPSVKPAAAKVKPEPKKLKAPKKDLKNKKDKDKEEVDLFDDGEVTESEELLEYQKDLELSEDDSDETEEVEDLAVDDSDDEEAVVVAQTEDEEDIFLTDAEGNRYCRAKDCDQIATVDSYCRFHYLALWKRIQIRKEILQDGKLGKYVDDLTSRYPDKFLEMLRKDLRSTKDFLAAIAELEIDESAGEGEFEEDAQTYIDEVRGLSDAASSSMEDDEF